MYNFRENKQIWDQNDYEERVKVEAEMMVGLEALKTATNYLHSDVSALDKVLAEQYLYISGNDDDIYEN